VIRVTVAKAIGNGRGRSRPEGEGEDRDRMIRRSRTRTEWSRNDSMGDVSKGDWCDPDICSHYHC
jgi:hypothetical protein